MFNKDLKEIAIREVKESAYNYNEKMEEATKKSIELHVIREKTNNEIIIPIERIIKKLKNSPENFSDSVNRLKIEYKLFEEKIETLKKEKQSANYKGAGIGVAGVAAGLGAAALLPTGAIALATTFGVASTGTAISALSGVAATNAALAWLGGGALLAGGGGMAAGSALLALTGPIGWGIGAAGIVGGGMFAASKNKEIAEKAKNQKKEIEKGIVQMKKGIIKIEGIEASTTESTKGAKQLLNILELYAPNDFESYSLEQKHMLGALINHVQSLTKLLNKKIV